LIETSLNNRRVFFKAEYQNPSGSFKDRGVEAMVSALRQLGATRVVEDSSGNAGASMAAFAARAGLQAEIYAPETASAVKLAQIELYGAQVKLIPGPRENSTRAVLEAVQGGAVYASHAWNPAYLLGQQTAAWEVWEQLGRRVPHWWVVPSGQGGHLLGVWLGFQRLMQSGLIDRLPRMVVAQSEAVAPLAEAIQTQKLKIEPVKGGKKTIAEGVVVTSPVRSTHILAEARKHGWLGVIVPEEEILPARQTLAHTGLFVEPTSALAVAALPLLSTHSRPDDIIVVSLTGSGLKVPIF
jgi:threonine synthase